MSDKKGYNGGEHSERDGAINTNAPLTITPDEAGAMAEADSTTGSSPAFQFYPGDFLSDPNVIVMTMQERGVYITLLALCWKPGSLPADLAQLAKLCATPLAAFKKLWPNIEVCFRPHGETPGRLVHPRLDREREKQEEYRLRQSHNGRKGGRPRNPEEPTAFQPETQTKPVGSSGLTQTEPKKSSSSLSLSLSSSSDFSRESVRAPGRTTGGVMAGSLPRDHINCRPPCVRICLSEKQHAVLAARYSGDRDKADADLDAFYAEIRSKLDPDEPIGQRPWEFWEQQYAARFASSVVPQGKTAGNFAAAARFVARGQA